jgi:hypothetical protein
MKKEIKIHTNQDKMMLIYHIGLFQYVLISKLIVSEIISDNNIRELTNKI